MLKARYAEARGALILLGVHTSTLILSEGAADCSRVPWEVEI